MIITIQIDTAAAEVNNPKDLAVLAALADCLAQGVTVTSKKTDKKPTAATEEKPEDTKADTKADKADTKADKADSGSKVTIKQLRELVSVKADKGHRDEIKEKLKEFGAPNTSSLDAEHFEAFFKFLNGLK